jgi:hypothetical protein
MMAVLVCLLISLGLSVLAPYWWWIMIVPFAYGATTTGGGKAARTGLLSAGLLWLGAGTYFYLTGGRIIAGRMAVMFGLGKAWTMIAATALVAGLAGGLAGYAGHAARAAFRKNSGKEPS